MSVMIGHAASNEYGGTHGGNPGDQTGNEVCIRTWYNRPWNLMFRPKDATVAEKIAVAMEQACANDNVGYNQNNRTSLFVAAKAKKWDISKVTTKVDCDCSALIAVCCNAAGLSVSKDNWTGVQKANLLATNAFTMYSTSQYLTQEDYLKRGDILLYEGHHTAVVLTNGSKTQPNVDYTGKGIGYATATTSMNIRTGAATSYPIIQTISAGTKLEVLEKLSNGWYKVVWTNISVGYGYVSNATGGYFKYVDKPGTNYRGTATTTTSMHIRTKPSTTGTSLGTVSAGTKLNVIEIMPNKWYKVEFKNSIGYISNTNGKYCKFSANPIYKWPEPIAKATAYSSMYVRDEASILGKKLGTISAKKTVDVYERAAKEVEEYQANERTLTQYIIGAISSLDVPKTPSVKGNTAMAAYFLVPAELFRSCPYFTERALEKFIPIA